MKNNFIITGILILLTAFTYCDTTTIAIVDFKVSSPDGRLDYLSSGIPEMLITDLSYQGGITIVERERLEEILDEQGLSITGALDNDEAARIGKLLGAEIMILGSLSQVGEKVRLDAHLVKVETGEAYGGQKVRGAGEANLFDLIDQLAQGIIASLQSQSMAIQADSPRIDVVFVIDSTGSMGDEINVVRSKIQEIVRTVKTGYPPPDVRFAIVDYKDKGDPYLARKFDFSRDTQMILNYLKGVAASGGGDTPESVGNGLKMALQDLSWETSEGISKMMFLIGDAPPHPREKNLWRTMTRTAVDKNVSIFTIACSGMNQQGIDVFRAIAQQTNGQFNFLTYKQTYVAADGRRRDVLLEGKSVYVADEPTTHGEWAGGGSSFAASREKASKKEADAYRILAEKTKETGDKLHSEKERLKSDLAAAEVALDDSVKEELEESFSDLENIERKLARKKGEVNLYSAKERVASVRRTSGEKDKYNKLAIEAQTEAKRLEKQKKKLEQELREKGREVGADEESVVELGMLRGKMAAVDTKTKENVRYYSDFDASRKKALSSKVEKLSVAAPSATPDMVASKMAEKGWKRDRKAVLANNLDSILTDVIKNEAQKRGVGYVTTSTIPRPQTVLASVRIKNRQREIWLKTTDAKVAQQFKELAERNGKAWFGGHVIPDEEADNGFYFKPGTIIVRNNEKSVASLIRVTVEKIARDAEYYNKHGLMTPNRWFIQGQVIDFREGEM